LDCATAAPDFTDDTRATADTRATDPRAARGAALATGAESEAAEDTEPLAPAEPVESADANGIDATAAPTPIPTPNATANNPTRPTYRAEREVADGDGITTGTQVDETRCKAT
jgi:hypothetical protein